MSVTPLIPQWRAHPLVHAAFTLRSGGVSVPPYDSLNVGVHVGDEVAAVHENRRRVREALGLPEEPAWLEQVHGTQVAVLGAPPRAALAAVADGIVTRQPGVVCAIQVADCLPVLFATRDGSAVAAAHAGWRGLAAGILEATVARLGAAAPDLTAWLGPCIGPQHFEVGAEVREVFTAHDRRAQQAFAPNSRGRWQCNLPALARQRLDALGVARVSGGEWCTYADAARYFSYRRDGRCGRMAALVWIE